ncbi:hypothetical protein GCM10028795_22850 [Lysobacter olei]
MWVVHAGPGRREWAEKRPGKPQKYRTATGAEQPTMVGAFRVAGRIRDHIDWRKLWKQHEISIEQRWDRSHNRK